MSEKQQRLTSNSMIVCAVLLSVYALYFSRTLILPVVVAFFVYLAFRPVMRRLSRYRVPTRVSAALIIFLLVSGVGLASYGIYSPAREFASELPQTMAVLKYKLRFVTERLQSINQATEELDEIASGDDSKPLQKKPVEVEISQPAWTNNLSILSGTGNLLTFVAVSIVLLYFFLAFGDQLLATAVSRSRTFAAKRWLVGMVDSVQHAIGDYLIRITAINIVLGIVVGIAMMLLGMPTPWMWGVMAATFNFVPILGALVGSGIIFLAALIHHESVGFSLAATATFITLTSIEGHFITPMLLGDTMDLNPLLVTLSLVFWGWLWGVVGVFLAVPILLTIQVIVRHWIEHRDRASRLEESADSDRVDQLLTA